MRILHPNKVTNVMERYHGSYISESEGCSYINVGDSGTITVAFYVREVVEKIGTDTISTKCPIIRMSFPRGRA